MTAETTFERALFGGGQLRAAGSGDDFYRKLHSVLGACLQIKNLSLLLGAGVSYGIGSPRIRAMSEEAIRRMIQRGGEAGSLPTAGDAFISQFVESGEGTADLEELLRTLTSALAVARGSRETHDLRLGELTLGTDDLIQTRRVINHALALDCDLPNLELIEDVSLKQDPLLHHRMFFQKLLRARRLDLPRLRIFTTNYDLVIEQALDACRISYFDGFVGTVERRFHPESFDQDLYLPAEADDRRLLRVPDVVYLYKLHGSIGWRSKSPTGGGPTEVVESHSPAEFREGELALIFPTPEKEADSLGYPYSALFRSFSESLQVGDAALLTIGYGFADDHINRLIYQALGNPSFQLFAVAPRGVADWAGTGPSEGEGEAPVAEGSLEFAHGILGSLAQTADARIHVLTGTTAGAFEDLASQGLPEAPDLETDKIAERTQTSLASVFFESEEQPTG